MTCPKPIDLNPASGLMDTASSPDLIPAGGYRFVLNWSITSNAKMCRSSGHRKFLSKEDYNNADLHDQLFGYNRQAVNFLFQAESVAGFTKIFAGTQSRIYALNTSTENWKCIYTSPETSTTCDNSAWWAAGIGGSVVFTNNIGPVLIHYIDQPVEADGTGNSVTTIRDLETLNVSKAGFCTTWNNLLFLCNLVEDGQRRTNVIIWSDYKRPASFVPKAGVSLAGRKELDYGEVILNAAPIGNALLIYTNKGIWQCTLAGTAQILSFTKRYDAKQNQTNCLAYARTLISSGSAHYYFGFDSVYRYDLYVPEPQKEEWLDVGSSRIFDDIDPAACNVHSGAYELSEKKLWWSWKKKSESCPSESFCASLQLPFTNYVDHGYTAFLQSNPDTLQSLRDFILKYCICTSDELDTDGGGFEREGGFCVAQPVTSCDVLPGYFYTDQPLDVGDGLVVEDYNQATASANSLCAIMGNLTVEDLCGDEFQSDTCNALQAFIMASSDDFCLKESEDVYRREECVGFSGCGTYQDHGYQSLLRSGPIDFGVPGKQKMLQEFTVEAEAADQVMPSQMTLRIGSSAKAYDPNGTSCPILWDDQEPRTLDCQADQTAAKYAAENSRPDEMIGWPLFHAGVFLYFELRVVNVNSTPVDAGGAVCISRISMKPGLTC